MRRSRRAIRSKRTTRASSTCSSGRTTRSTSSGQGAYPIAGFASFYITGFGRTNGGGFQGGFSDPCTSGNDGDLYNGNGSEPPPDLSYTGNTFYIWGHFVKDVVPTASTSGTTGVLCKPLISFMPCVAVLVE